MPERHRAERLPALFAPSAWTAASTTTSDHPQEDICSLRFFPNVSTRSGASPGHFYTDASQHAFGIQIEVTSLSTKMETVQELLVPIQALKASMQSPVYRRASVCYEPFIG